MRGFNEGGGMIPLGPLQQFSTRQNPETPEKTPSKWQVILTLIRLSYDFRANFDFSRQNLGLKPPLLSAPGARPKCGRVGW